MSEPTAPVGRRERKKAATRQALADAALRLFLEHGYEQVSIKDVAESADVSTTTLFKHFPSKEALVFDQDADREAALVAAIRQRPAGQSVLDALRDHVTGGAFTDAAHRPEFKAFMRLIESNPALRDYHRRMWIRHEQAVARSIAEETAAPPDDLSCRALAHFVLEAATFDTSRDDSLRALDAAFELLKHGWDAVSPGDTGTEAE
ncbi:MAG TPA: TetR family transcriptional regulator [Ruania sp.]|nr:TetR family transcriptional regulator [Ruania sp.]